MADGFTADPRVIGNVVAALRRGSAGLEQLAGSVPVGVDAGAQTAVIPQALGALTEAAGVLSAWVVAAAEAVTAAGATYRQADQGSAVPMRTGGGSRARVD